MVALAGTGALSACRIGGGRDPNTLIARLTYDFDTFNVYSTGFLGDLQAAGVEGLLAPDAHPRYVPELATRVPTWPMAASV